MILPETRLEALVSYTKGCYIGQETVARVKYRGHVNRALSGLVLEGERVPGEGARVIGGRQEVGRVTSAVRSIALGRPDRARLRAPRALRAGHRGDGRGWRRRAAGPGRRAAVRRAEA